MRKQLIKFWSVFTNLFVLGVVGAPRVLAQPIIYEGYPITLTEIEDVINIIIRFLYGIGGVIVAGFLIWGAIKWASARGDATRVKEAQDTIKAAIWGAFVLFGIGVILATIRIIIERGFFS